MPTPSHEHTPFWKYFTPAEQAILRDIPPHDLTPEIRLLIAGQAQLFEEAQRAPTQDHDQQAADLNVYGNASVCIGFMERTRLKVQGLRSRYDSVIQAAYKLARQQMGVKTYLLESTSSSEEPTE